MIGWEACRATTDGRSLFIEECLPVIPVLKIESWGTQT